MIIKEVGPRLANIKDVSCICMKVEEFDLKQSLLDTPEKILNVANCMGT